MGCLPPRGAPITVQSVSRFTARNPWTHTARRSLSRSPHSVYAIRWKCCLEMLRNEDVRKGGLALGISLGSI